MKTLKYILFVFLFASIAYSAGTKVTLSTSGNAARITSSKTYADSNVDTVVVTRDAALSALSFGVSFLDSTSITNIIVRRVIDGVLQPVQLGDTVSGALALTAAGARTYNVVLTSTTSGSNIALADAYWFFVTYAGSANGVTTPTVKYEAIKQYYYKQ